MVADVRLLIDEFDPVSELAIFSDRHDAAGGIVSFLGKVRGGDGVEALELRHYGPLTLPGMEALAQETQRRWTLEGLPPISRWTISRANRGSGNARRRMGSGAG